MNLPAETPPKRPVIRKKSRGQPEAAPPAEAAETVGSRITEPTVTVPLSVWEHLQVLALAARPEHPNQPDRPISLALAYAQALRRR